MRSIIAAVGLGVVLLTIGCNTAPHRRKDGADDDRHPQQRAEAFAEADAAERGEAGQDSGSNPKAKEHPGWGQFPRPIVELCHALRSGIV